MTPFNRTTLANVLDALGSEHAGEALAAARLATTMLREGGFSWDDVLRRDLPALKRPAPSPAGQDAASTPAGPGPMGMRRERELSPYEQFFMLLLSPRTPIDVKKKLRGWEGRVLDGEITPQDTQDLRQMFRKFVA